MLAGSSALDQARARWEHGDWAAILTLDTPALESDPERAKLALLLSAAHSHAGAPDRARHLARQALVWGASPTMAARVLLSAAQNSLARAAAALEEDAGPHFEAAIRLVQPHADAPLLARSRRVRELATLGLLPQAAEALEQEMGLVRAEAVGMQDPRIQMLDSRLSILKHELRLSLSRGQLYRGGAPEEPDHPLRQDDLERLSVSQLGQDLWVLKKTGYKRGGFFVEFGATDGVMLSNTYLLEKTFGWTGICAEPNPEYFRQLQENRACILSNACIGAESGQKVDFVLADEFGTINSYVDVDQHAEKRGAFRQSGQVIEVETTSLSDLLIRLGAPREIDYLSIDTEGSEFDILNAFDFDRWKIRLISVEHNFTEMRQKIFDLLTGLGYVRTELQWDDLYELAP